MRFCTCGLVVGDIRMADGKLQPVEPMPIHYRRSDSGSMQLIIREGQVVQAASCRPDEKEGVGYPMHRCPGVLV